MSKKNTKKRKLLRPDDVYYFGPLGIARFGNFLNIRNFMNENEHQEFMKRAAKSYPDICKKIDQRINKICGLISLFDPLTLLQCGFFKYFEAFRGEKSSIKIDADTSMAMSMIDYVQSVIVSIPPADKATAGFDQEKWDELALEMKKLYSELNLTFHIYHTAYLKSTNKDYDEEYDAFYVEAQMLWTNVRGNRYMFHNLSHLRDLLKPHNDIFSDLFGVSIDDFVAGLEKLQRSLNEGLPRVTLELREFQEKTLTALKEKLNSETANNASPPEMMQEIIKEYGWQDWQESVFGRFFKFDLLDVKKVTGLPETLLRELSWKTGEYQGLFAPGEFAGWPLRVLPIQIRPFINVNGRYYCFELLNLMDNLYRVIQRLITRLRPEYKEIWNERQKTIAEELPFTLFMKLLPSAKTYRAVYHRWRTGKSGEMNWCETDGLIIFDDHLIIIEIKAGAFTHSPPATDFPAYMNSIKDLVLKPALQSKRFLEYLESNDEVTIYGSNHEPITKLRRDQFRNITSCCVTLDNFTTLAAQAENLKPIVADLQDFSIWSICIDDLRVYTDIFDSPVMFTHFLEERKRAFKSPALRATDELDHLCLYLKHNRYVSYAEDFYNAIPDAEPVRWHGYREDLDKYYADLLYFPDVAKKPCQQLPNRLDEIVKTIGRGEKSGRCKAASYLLDMNGDTRNNFNSGIEQVLLKQKEKRHIVPLSLLGNINLTIFCEQKGVTSRASHWKRDYVFATMLRSKENERMMLTLFFDEDNKIADVDFEFIYLKDIPANRYEEIVNRSENQRKHFIQAYLKQSGKKKVGRNEICPCGSGRKYKQCCM